MKKAVFVSAFALLAVQCNKNGSQPEPQAAYSTTTPAPVENKPEESTHLGAALIKKSDCTSCHSADQKLVGPSYKEIAAKYTAKDAEMLAGKIIEGGSGVWGSTPMSPHPTMSKEDAAKMVEYILTLK